MPLYLILSKAEGVNSSIILEYLCMKTDTGKNL